MNKRQTREQLIDKQDCFC